MKKLLIVVIAFISTTHLFSQSVLERATYAYRENKSCELLLNISIKTIGDEIEQKRATLLLYGDKYSLEFDDQRIFNDGNSNYTYNKSLKELVIEKTDSLSPLQSPRSLLAINSNLFDIIDTTTLGEVTFLTLKSNSKIAGVDKIRLSIKDNKLGSITVADNVGNTIDIEILATTFGKKIDPNSFKYNKGDYKEVEIIDFR